MQSNKCDELVCREVNEGRYITGFRVCRGQCNDDF